MNYTTRDEPCKPARLRRLATPGAVLLRPARAPAVARRTAAALAGAVSHVAPDRAGPTGPDGSARGDARLRRVQRHRARGSARIARSRAPSPVGRGSPGESLGSHADRFPASRSFALSEGET